MVNKKKASSKEKPEPETKDKVIVLTESPDDLEHRVEMLEKRLGIKSSKRDR